MPHPRSLRRFLFVGATLLLRPAMPGAPVEPLTSASAVLSLSGDEAGTRLKVHVTGVVTAAEPDWNGKFFVQDGTSGVFVENLKLPPPQVGDLIELEGVTHPGAFAPIISLPVWRRLGSAELPAPKHVSPEELMSGVEDSQRVEVTGVVRTAIAEPNRLQIDLSFAGHRLQVSARPMPDTAPSSLIGARVRVRGTAASHYLMSLRHLTSVVVYAPRTEDFSVLETEAIDPLTEPPTPVRNVAQYRRDRRPEQRVHVRGTVTLAGPRTDLFLQDNSGGIRIAAVHTPRCQTGDTVDAVGFLEYENLLPVLRDATVSRLAVPNTRLTARRVPFVEVARGEHHGDLIRLSGRVLEHSTQPYVRADGRHAGLISSWLVQSPEVTFTVEYVGPDEHPTAPEIPVGSVVEVDGVCVSNLEPAGAGGETKLTSLRLLVASPADVRLLQKPSWFTPERLLIGLALVAVILLVVLAWLLTIARKNKALHRAVDQLQQARDALQEAHDTLEEKVAERSAQLQVEMTARKAEELQFKGVLAERTRLARDLHDTLEQTLTGIALRLKTAAKLSRLDLGASEVHLQTARNWLHQSQVDLRRSIWDLRSRELEEFDLARALRSSAEHLTEEGAIHLEFTASGTPHGLSEIAEENVLRIAQEALTNIARHARATQVKLQLEFGATAMRLRLEDNGIGFDQSQGVPDGHFGLIGMMERAKRISARLFVDSGIGRGTTVVLEVPLAAETAATSTTTVADRKSPSP
jgi:signal transduction histidine kinase